jgi:hypothetical protein
LKRRLAILAAALALTVLTALPICNAVFHCGCASVFAGSDAHCDVHRAGPPDCPVCADWLLGAPFFFGIFAAWALLAGLVPRLFRPRG